MLKISENNGTEEIGLVTPTPGDHRHLYINPLMRITKSGVVCGVEGDVVKYNVNDEIIRRTTIQRDMDTLYCTSL